MDKVDCVAPLSLRCPFRLYSETFRLETRETGLEPATSDVTGRCSNQLNYSRKNKLGRNRTRTYDHLCVRQELYQLSYTPLQNDIQFTEGANFLQAKRKEA